MGVGVDVVAQCWNRFDTNNNRQQECNDTRRSRYCQTGAIPIGMRHRHNDLRHHRTICRYNCSFDQQQLPYLDGETNLTPDIGIGY